MKFRTEIEIANRERQLDYSSRILSLGSCFASSIGGRLQEMKFDIEINPVGVLFNPISISATLDRFMQCRLVDSSELQSGRGEWFHFDFHGSLSAATPEQALSNMNRAVERGSERLLSCDTVIITLGTAWIYQIADSAQIVANCHKEPHSRFVRRALSVGEVVEALARVVERYLSKQFILSLSPIRHLADGLAENSLSKATLRVAIAQLVERYENVSYFPAYEIMLDDLRDYRFYADDMLHPSKQAIDYIWSKFCSSQITLESNVRMEKVAQIVRAAAHRPLNVASSAHQDFCRRQLELIKMDPDIDFGKESAYFMSQLQNNL